MQKVVLVGDTATASIADYGARKNNSIKKNEADRDGGGYRPIIDNVAAVEPTSHGNRWKSLPCDTLPGRKAVSRSLNTSRSNGDSSAHVFT